MGNINSFLRGGDTPVERRERNRGIMDDFRDKWGKIPFLTISDMVLIFNRHGIDIERTIVCYWIREKNFFDKKGVRKQGRRWLITKRAVEKFLTRMENLDMENYVEANKKPRKKRRTGIRSKRESSLYTRGVVSDKYNR